MKKNFDLIQVCRGLAAIVVILFHTHITLMLPKYLNLSIFPIFNAGDSGVEFFFVLSGFIIYYIHFKDLGKVGNLKSFFIKRAIRIYPPLWVALLFVAPMIYFLTEDFTLNRLFASIFLYPIEKEKILAVVWSLRHEILFYLFFSTLLFSKKLGIVINSIWLSFCFIALFYNFSFPFSFIFSPYNLLFLFGAFSAYLFIKDEIYYPNFFLIFGLIIFFLTWGLTFNGTIPKNNIVHLSYGIGASLIIGSLVKIEEDIEFKSIFVKIGKFLGDASYSIYLVHFPIVSAMSKVSTKFYKYVNNPELIFFIVAFISLCCGIFFHIFVEKPLLKFINKSIR